MAPLRQQARKRKTQDPEETKVPLSDDAPPRVEEGNNNDRENGDNSDDCRCEVDRLTVSTISQPAAVVDPGTGLTNVIRNAWFVAYFRNNGCCNCCEFRQYIRGYAEVDGVAMSPPVPGFNFLGWNEDQDVDGMHYGHRDERAEDGDRYVPDQDRGCIYVGRDAPGVYGLASGDDYFIYFEFVDVIIDTCNDDEVVAGPETWDMIAAGTVP